jgi:hypothetical protein
MNRLIKTIEDKLKTAEFSDYIFLEKDDAQYILNHLQNDIELIKLFYKDDESVQITSFNVYGGRYSIYITIPNADPNRMISAEDWIEAIKKIEKIRYLCGSNT